MRFIHVFSVSLILFFYLGSMSIKLLAQTPGYARGGADPTLKSPPVSPAPTPRRTPSPIKPVSPVSPRNPPFEFQNAEIQTETNYANLYQEPQNAELRQQDYQAVLNSKDQTKKDTNSKDQTKKDANSKKQTKKAKLKGKIPQRAEIRSQIMGVEFVPSSPVLIPQ